MRYEAESDGGSVDKKSKKRPFILLLLVGGGACLLALCGVGGYLVSESIHQFTSYGELPEGASYNEWRSGFESDLLVRAPAPQDFGDEPLPPGVSIETYESGDLALKSWVYRPPTSDQRRPALLFLHGGFAFGVGDLTGCQEAIDRDFIVMAPALRGENGNPGNFELFLGEVDDARAAAVWLAEQPDVDPDRIYVFGHSVGGGVAAVLSLLDDVPVQHTGSSGGLYPPDIFVSWADITPFRNGPQERMARLLLGNTIHMQRPHFAYLGREDVLHSSAAIARQESPGSALLKIETVPGDHFNSFTDSLHRYLDLIP